MVILEELEAVIESRSSPGRRTLIGIDGFGGSGKSALADQIGHHFPGSSIIHIDDFYKPRVARTQLPSSGSVVDPNYDWDRLIQAVFAYGTTPAGFTYQRYDWASDRLADYIHIPGSSRLLVIEGVYALQSRFFERYTVKIWVEAPDDLILQRAVERDGPDQLAQWRQEWMPRERHYQRVEQPDQKADLVVKGY